MMLWFALRDRRLNGFKFSRQQPIDRYYVDFIRREHRLIVEVDGNQHLGSILDRPRDARLAELGYRVVRFWNSDVLANLDGVLEMLLSKLAEAPHPVPLPASGERVRS